MKYSLLIVLLASSLFASAQSNTEGDPKMSYSDRALALEFTEISAIRAFNWEQAESLFSVVEDDDELTIRIVYKGEEPRYKDLEFDMAWSFPATKLGEQGAKITKVVQTMLEVYDESKN